VWGCAYSPDGTRIVSASRDNTLKEWETQSGKLLRTWKGEASEIQRLTQSPDGTRTVSASEHGAVIIRGNTSGKTLRTFYQLPDGAYASFDGDNNLLACSESAWPYLALRWYDADAKRCRLLPAEFCGPLPIEEGCGQSIGR
jgi:WD40 repeat protein